MSEITEISILSNIKHLVWQFTSYNVLNMLQHVILPIGMQDDVMISWSITNDQDIIIHNYACICKFHFILWIAILDTFQVKVFTAEELLQKEELKCTPKNCVLYIFSAFLSIWIYNFGMYNFWSCWNIVVRKSKQLCQLQLPTLRGLVAMVVTTCR